MTTTEVKIVGVKTRNYTKDEKSYRITELHTIGLKPFDGNNYLVEKYTIFDNQSTYNVGEKVKVYTLWNTQKKQNQVLLVERLEKP